METEVEVPVAAPGCQVGTGNRLPGSVQMLKVQVEGLMLRSLLRETLKGLDVGETSFGIRHVKMVGHCWLVVDIVAPAGVVYLVHLRHVRT